MQQIRQSQPTAAMLLTVAQVAQALQLSRAKVYQLVYTGGLPTVNFGKAIRVRPEALQRWVEQQEK